MVARELPDQDHGAFVKAINEEMERNRESHPTKDDEEEVDDSERLMALLDQNNSRPAEAERKVGGKADSNLRRHMHK